MDKVGELRNVIVAVPIKEHVQNKWNTFKSTLKSVGLLRASDAGYGQMTQETGEPKVHADGSKIVKEEKTYKDDTCKGRCMYYACCRCSKRYYTAWLSSLGFMITFGIRCNMSWAMLSMISRHNLSKHAHVPPVSHSKHQMHLANPGHVIDLAGIINVTTKPDFYWTAEQRGFVDSSFFYGYLVTQIPGGVIAAKFPANKLFGIAVGGSALLNLFLPAACEAHFGLVMAIRILQGLVEGTSYPACHGIWRYWAPPLERSRLATIAFCGSYAGAVFGLSLSGMLAEKLGWQSPFYVYGIIGLFWFVWWWRVTHERPSLHPTITEAERTYIETSIGDSPNIVESKIPIPWGKFAVSMPVYAIIVANFARSWSFYLLITKTPKYFQEVFGYTMTETGFYSALPHLVMAIIVPLGGQLADRLRKKLLSTTAVRKIFNCGGFGMEAVFLLGVGYSKTIGSALICLVMAVGFSGFAISGYNVNHLDIAPRYASILMGLSNGFGTIAGMICPLTTELLTKETNKEGWSIVFLIASLVHFAGVIFYAIFASGEKQPWAEAPIESMSNWQPPTDFPPEITSASYGYSVDDDKLAKQSLQTGSTGNGLVSYISGHQTQQPYEYGYEQRADKGMSSDQLDDAYHQAY